MGTKQKKYYEIEMIAALYPVKMQRKKKKIAKRMLTLEVQNLTSLTVQHLKHRILSCSKCTTHVTKTRIARPTTSAQSGRPSTTAMLHQRYRQTRQ